MRYNRKIPWLVLDMWNVGLSFQVSPELASMVPEMKTKQILHFSWFVNRIPTGIHSKRQNYAGTILLPVK
jgi:hypothetical protein